MDASSSADATATAVATTASSSDITNAAALSYRAAAAKGTVLEQQPGRLRRRVQRRRMSVVDGMSDSDAPLEAMLARASAAAEAREAQRHRAEQLRKGSALEQPPRPTAAALVSAPPRGDTGEPGRILWSPAVVAQVPAAPTKETLKPSSRPETEEADRSAALASTSSRPPEALSELGTERRQPPPPRRRRPVCALGGLADCAARCSTPGGRRPAHR
jgi:hypothetical protein